MSFAARRATVSRRRAVSSDWNTMAPSATSADDKGFIGDGAVVSYLNNKETTMKFTAVALASVLALSSSCAFAHTVRHKSHIKIHRMYSDAAPSVVPDPRYGNPNGNFGGTGNADVWGHLGAYYGPMIPSGGGGR
jgi:hypothetical protein